MKTKLVLVTAICALTSFASFGQETPQEKSFVINGNTNDFKLDSVLIQYINSKGKIVQESYPADQGKFSVKGFIAQPTFSYLIFKNKGEIIDKKEMELKRTVAYLSPGTMTVTTTPVTGEFLELQGSKTQDEWKELSQKTKGLTGAQLAKISYDYFRSHPGSFVTADRIKFFSSVFSLDSIKLIYEHFPVQLKESMDVKRLAAEIKSREVGIPGTRAYRFNVKDKDDKELSLEKMKGKYVLLDFWATWCVPCRASMPDMISLNQKYKDKNFILIGISDDDTNVKNWLLAIEKDGTAGWPQTLRGLDRQLYLQGVDNPRDLSQQYGVKSYPTKILIGPDGTIVGRYDSKNKSDEDLTSFLANAFK